MPERVGVLARVLEPVLAELDLDLYDIELVGTGRARTLRVTLDRPRDQDARGVDLDAITAATEALSPLLDRAGESDPALQPLLRGSYTLEVTTPGLERTLRTPAHFRGAVGSLVSIKTRGDDSGPGRRRGVLVGADDVGLELEADGTRDRIGYDEVVQARTIFEWGGTPKPRGPRSGRAKRRSATKQSGGAKQKVAR